MKKTSLLASASYMGIAVFLSRIFGLIREQLFAYLFGATSNTDAFLVAFRIPNLLRDLFAEGAMSAAFIPTFIATQQTLGEKEAWKLGQSSFKVLAGLSLLLACLGIFSAHFFVDLYAHSFTQESQKFFLTVSMTQIMFLFFPCVVIAALFMGMLNALGVFFIPAFSSALFNIVSIFTGGILAFLLPLWGVESIIGMAIGVVVGGVVQMLCQWPMLKKLGYAPVWSAPLFHPNLKKILRLMLPTTIGFASTQINVFLTTFLATGLQEGAVSYLNYAFRLMQFPLGVFGVSFSTALLPEMSRFGAQKNYQKMYAVLHECIYAVLAINVPAAIGLAILSEDIVRLLFEHGSFVLQDTLKTSAAIVMYCIGLPAYSLLKVFVPVCYAFEKSSLAVLSSIISVIFSIFLNMILVNKLGYLGLALATAITAILNSGFLIIVIYTLFLKQGIFFSLPKIFQEICKIFIAAVMMGFCAVMLKKIFTQQVSFFLDIGRVFGIILLSILAYIGFAFLLNIQSAQDIFLKLVKKVF